MTLSISHDLSTILIMCNKFLDILLLQVSFQAWILPKVYITFIPPSLPYMLPLLPWIYYPSLPLSNPFGCAITVPKLQYRILLEQNLVTEKLIFIFIFSLQVLVPIWRGSISWCPCPQCKRTSHIWGKITTKRTAQM